MMNSTIRLSALIAATALLAACGGGGGGSTPQQSTGNNQNSPSNPSIPNNPTTPVNDAAQYKGYLQASLKLMLGVDDVAKTLYQLPAKIKADVESHPFTQVRCDSTCVPGVDTSQWVTFPVSDGGTVRLEDWTDWSSVANAAGNDLVTPDSVFSTNDSIRVDANSITSSHGQVMSFSAALVITSLPYPNTFSFTSNYENTRRGLIINGKSSPEFTGSLNAKVVDGRYEISDTSQGDTGWGHNLNIVEKDGAGTVLNSFMTAITASTNLNDLDQLSFDADMINYIGGATLKLKTVQPLNFGKVENKLQIESGSYTYEYKDPNAATAAHFALRVTVDADPAYLNVEIDDNADGTYDKSGRLPQSDFDYSF